MPTHHLLRKYLGTYISIQQVKQQDKYLEELSEIKPTLKKYETTKLKQEKHILKLEELSKDESHYYFYSMKNEINKCCTPGLF